MRSLELACIVVGLVALAEVGYHLISPRPNLQAIARRLVYEIEHASGAKVIDIGLEALVIIDDDKLKLIYQGSSVEITLSQYAVGSYWHTTHAWLGGHYELKHGSVERGHDEVPILLYTMLPEVEYKLYETMYEEHEEGPIRLKVYGAPWVLQEAGLQSMNTLA
ncbi:MAG: hypothetical protein DRN15_11545 [Thermoprotei archaeon]|nr:MAG: hypothetical protein DRN15_11545 [Thermoprotei archaeon]